MQNLKENIYIPFLDKTLNCDCKACGGHCCKSGNIILNTKEKKKILGQYPDLKFFSCIQTGKKYGIKKFPDCWFLNKDKSCNIHKQYGYSAKPFICRLHPFYLAQCKSEDVIRIIGCPMLRAARTGNNVTHKQIFANAAEGINLDVTSGELDLSARRLKLEKKILEGSKRYLKKASYLDFAAFQMALSGRAKNIEGIKMKLLEQLSLWKSFLGIESMNIDNPEVSYELTIFTPMLRLETELFKGIGENNIPLALLALYIYMLIHQKVKKTERYYDTYKLILGDRAKVLLQIGEKDYSSLMGKSVEERLHYLNVLRKLPEVNGV